MIREAVQAELERFLAEHEARRDSEGRRAVVRNGYLLEREIVALSESRRTESNWVRTTFLDAGTKEPKAEMILNNATLKHSFEGYEKERAAYEEERAATV